MENWGQIPGGAQLAVFFSWEGSQGSSMLHKVVGWLWFLGKEGQEPMFSAILLTVNYKRQCLLEDTVHRAKNGSAVARPPA